MEIKLTQADIAAILLERIRIGGLVSDREAVRVVLEVYYDREVGEVVAFIRLAPD